MRWRPALLIVVALTAGCASLFPEPDADDVAPLAVAPAPPAPTREPAESPRAHVTLDAVMDVEERWIRPGEEVVARARVDGALQHAWLLASRNPVPAEAHHRTGPAPGGLALLLAPGERSGEIALDRAGRLVFETEGARLGVTLRPDAPAQPRVRVPLRDAAFAPHEVTLGVGSSLVLHNERAEPARVLLADALEWLAGGGPELRFTFPAHLELGDYDLVVVGDDAAGGFGEASARLIYDSRKPLPEARFGPFEGGFQLPVGANARHPFESRHDMRELRVTFEVRSDAPAPATVRVTLLDEAGATLHESEPTAQGAFEIGPLPAGRYALVVERVDGVMLQYEADARAVLELRAPDTFFAD